MGNRNTGYLVEVFSAAVLSSSIMKVLCIALVLVAPAAASNLQSAPDWQITKPGTDNSVKWTDADNPRFATYDAGTPANEADDVVFDKETRLVWMKIPGVDLKTWYDATYECINVTAGGRMGWRLPTIEELQSLWDPVGDGNLSLPNGHPFDIIDDPGTQPSYWTSTSDIQNPAVAAYPICFSTGGCLYEAIKSNASNYVWCVRGGYGYDAY